MAPQFTPPRRISRVFAYSAFATTGFTSIMWPVASVVAATQGARYLTFVWAGMLIAGGIISALGAAVDRWIGEYVGLLPMMVTFVIYALAVAAAGTPTSVAGSAFLSGVALILFARWRDVAHIRVEAARHRAAHGER